MGSHQLRAEVPAGRSAIASRRLVIERAILGVTLIPAIFAKQLPLAVTIPAAFLMIATVFARLPAHRRGPSIGTLPVWLLACIFVPMSVFVSPLVAEVSWPRAVCLIWSLAMFGSIANDTGPSRIRLHIWLQIFVMAGVGFAILNYTFLKLADNEIGGALILFLPVALVLAAAPRTASSVPRTVWIGAALILIAAICLTRSRGAYLGTAVAVCTLLIIIGRKKGIIALGVCSILGAGGSVLLWQHAEFRVFILGGTIQGATFENFTTGRLPIWDSSLHAIHDFPFTGIGIGVLGGALSNIYPSGHESKALEDAHNQFLQAAADFGIAGGLVWIGVWCLAAFTGLKLLRHFSNRNLAFFAVAGCLAALAGHFAYSLVDSVSPGCPGGIPFWFLVALIVRLHRQHSGRTGEMRDGSARPRIGLVAIGVFALVVIAPALLAKGNQRSLESIRILFNASSAELKAANLEAMKNSDPPCRARWMRGLIAEAAGDEATRAAEWRALIHCSPGHIRMLRAKAPEARELAEAAIEAWPEDAAGYFWMVQVVEAEKPQGTEETVAYLREGLERSPSSGRHWRQLGDLLSAGEKDLPGALEAYRNACENGDPGAGCCARAGSIAESLGRHEEALIYYRKSNWQPAHDRALELEAAMRAGKSDG